MSEGGVAPHKCQGTGTTQFLIPVLSPLSLSPPPFFPTAGSVVDAPVFDNVFAVVAM